jgi:ribosomal protein L34E
MPVSLGILCERCRTVYFIRPSGKSPHIHYERKRGEFCFACDPPCHAVTYFHRTMLRPYSVSAEAQERGYADIDECQLVSDMRNTAS